MKYAIVENGTVVNSIVAADQVQADKFGLAIQNDLAGPGWTYDGLTFSPPVNVGIVQKKTHIDMAKLFLNLTDAEQEMVLISGTTRAMRFQVAATANLSVKLTRIQADLVEVFGQLRADELIELS